MSNHPRPELASRLISAIDAFLAFVPKEGTGPRYRMMLPDGDDVVELGRLDTDVSALCQLLAISYVAPNAGSSGSPFGFTGIPGEFGRLCYDSKGRFPKDTVVYTVSGTPNWIQAMLGLRRCAELVASSPTNNVVGDDETRKAPQGQSETENKQTSKKRGRQPLKESNPVLFQIYQRIWSERDKWLDETRKPRPNHGGILKRLQADKQFGEQVREAKENLNLKLIRKALSYRATKNSRGAQQNPPK